MQYLIGFVFLIVLIGYLIIGIKESEKQREIDSKKTDEEYCSQFVNGTTRNLPNRCLYYFNGSEK